MDLSFKIGCHIISYALGVITIAFTINNSICNIIAGREEHIMRKFGFE
jgi:hypothetical protein